MKYLSSKYFFSVWLSLALVLLVTACDTVTYLTVLNDADRRELRRHNVPSSLYEQMILREPLSLEDIVILSQCQVSTDFTIRYLDTSGGRYQLTGEDVVSLKNKGVSQVVIAHLKEVRPPVATQVLQGIGSIFVGK